MEPYTVQAEYSFQGGNNDELCFKKGDIITVTQREDGGWWEGTLNDVTGWFPSNYVKEYKGKSNDNQFHTLFFNEYLFSFVSLIAIGRNCTNTRRNQSMPNSCP